MKRKIFIFSLMALLAVNILTGIQPTGVGPEPWSTTIQTNGVGPEPW